MTRVQPGRCGTAAFLRDGSHWLPIRARARHAAAGPSAGAAGEAVRGLGAGWAAGARAQLAAAGVAGSGGFEQEPDAAFGFVEPGFDEAGGGDVVVAGADVVGFA